MRFGGLSLLLLLLGGCASDLPEGHRATPEGDGPRILWDLYAEPLPDIPLPNDVATWPDPSRATGRRLNASLLVDTETERQIRRYFDELDGWGTFAPITIPFWLARSTWMTAEMRMRSLRGTSSKFSTSTATL